MNILISNNKSINITIAMTIKNENKIAGIRLNFVTERTEGDKASTPNRIKTRIAIYTNITVTEIRKILILVLILSLSALLSFLFAVSNKYKALRS